MLKIIKASIVVLVIIISAVLTISLSGCTSREGLASSSSSQSTSSTDVSLPTSSDMTDSSTSSRHDPELAPAKTPTEVAERFIEALTTKNMTAVAKYTGTEVSVYEDWQNVDFEEITYKTLHDDYSTLGHYDFVFNVSKSDQPMFPVGSSHYEVKISLGDSNNSLYVTAIYPPNYTPFERTAMDMARPGYEAYDMVNQLLSYTNVTEFNSPADVPIDELVDFILIQLAKESNFEKSTFTIDDVNKKATELFDLSTFDGTSSIYFNKTDKIYNHMGHGFSKRYRQTISAEFSPETGRYTVPVSFFSDPLCTKKECTILYTLQKNGNTLKFISGMKE